MLGIKVLAVLLLTLNLLVRYNSYHRFGERVDIAKSLSPRQIAIRLFSKSHDGYSRTWKRNSFKSADEVKVKSKDPWGGLAEKLDSTRSAKQIFGKLEKAVGQNDVVERVDVLKCIHFNTCSGCSIRSNFNETSTITRARRFFQTQDIDMAIHTGNITEWRTHAKLAVQPLSKWGGLKFGLYKSGTHIVEPIPNCRVHHPQINLAVEQLRKEATDAGVRGYSEPEIGKSGSASRSQGSLRYIQLSLERSTGRVQLVLVWNAISFKEAGATLPRLVKRLKSRPDLWKSITVNFHTSNTNAIFNYNSRAWKTLWGPPLLKEKVGDADFYFTPQIFRQSNLDAFEEGIIPLVSSKVPPDSIVAELYSGIGLIGLNLAKSAKEVICSDSNEFVDSVFDKCVDSLPKRDQHKMFFECFSAEEAVEQGQCSEAEVLVVDPPRKGLDDAVLQLITKRHPSQKANYLKRVIYVSCGYEALEKDIRTILSSEKWRISSADGFVLFPGSDHIESVIVFDRF